MRSTGLRAWPQDLQQAGSVVWLAGPAAHRLWVVVALKAPRALVSGCGAWA